MDTEYTDKELPSDAYDANLEDSDDDDELDLGSADRKILTQTLDERLEGLVARVRKGRLVLQPDFQRDFVWSRSKASLLIESILMGIPLPVVYVSELADGTWEVVDGQQRLTAIKSFIDGVFPDGNKFKLSKLKVRHDLRGKSFQELSTADQIQIEDYTLRLIKIQKEAHEDIKFEVFERLNSGAERLNDMELRNCIYRGSYNDLLEELSKHPVLLKIRGEELPDKRMWDRQLLLRFFAMWRKTHLHFRSPMKQFMNHEMQVYRHASPEQIDEMRRVFSNAIQIAWDVFGENAFRRYTPPAEAGDRGRWDNRGRFNVALWDTVLYVFTFFERRQVLPVADAVREEFLDVMTNDQTFVDYIGRTTDKTDRIRYRAETWRKRIEPLITTPSNESRSFSRDLKYRLFEANSACAICAQQIHAVDDAEIDHIEHYWRGGRTVPENARLTHRLCNRVRGGH
ncbi:DUF262 domain-containing protein [Henriciella sp.]|uniref:GmrSD restriction endonuclease domain-containing protein n=1 Tax=Henriciella sp. TaxID=1968823 RepID=UPI002632E5ED|nr:DUF262 domain-containing protein [Henriciella sp.]